MARIYLRWPQCFPWNFCKERPLIHHVTCITCGCLLLVMLIIFFIQARLYSAVSEEDTRSIHPSFQDQIDKTLHIYGPDVHYGIVLDCGSSGSRVYVYIWPPHSGNPRDLLNIQQLKDSNNKPIVKKVTPGLDSFGDNPEEASEYIRPLLQYAASHIPRNHHKETLLYILATAGMRMLPKEKQDAILEDLQRDIPKEFNFVISENNFEVISGKQEGVYAWIAVNYILQKFSHGEEDHPLVAVDVQGEGSRQRPHIRRRTVGMIDMGGGSMQIAYEITSRVDNVPKHLIAEFNLGCHNSDIEHNYRVYVTTFLGFGANAARERYEKMLLATSPKIRKKRNTILNEMDLIEKIANISARKKSLKRGSEVKTPADYHPKTGASLMEDESQIPEKPVETVHISDKSQATVRPQTKPTRAAVQNTPNIIPDPCLPEDLEISASDQSGKVFKGTGDYKKCQSDLVPLLNTSVPCIQPPCSFNGVHQPFISYGQNEFYGFSELWYTMEDVYRIGGEYEYDTFDIQSRAFCGTKWSTLQDWYKKKLYPKADENRFRSQCFKAAWVTTVLHQGLKFPENYRNLQSVQYINNRDVQWTLGALIHRTRYLPLRDIEKLKMSHFKPAWVGASNLFYNEYLILVCFTIVVMAILLYIKRLKICAKSKGQEMKKVPSMSYLLDDPDNIEQGLHFHKSQSYPNFYSR